MKSMGATCLRVIGNRRGDLTWKYISLTLLLIIIVNCIVPTCDTLTEMQSQT